MITARGDVKVLDFGLAKLTDPAETTEEDDTRTQRVLTEEGSVVGSAPYMSPDHESGNLAPWRDIAVFIGKFPEDNHWTPWKILARRFVQEGLNIGLNRYFRAGQTMSDLVFSTLDHHGLRDEPRVTIVFHAPDEVRIVYGKGNPFFLPPEVEYSLPFDPAFATFRRFLCQLWTATMPGPVPEVARPVWAPVLTSGDR